MRKDGPSQEWDRGHGLGVGRARNVGVRSRITTGNAYAVSTTTTIAQDRPVVQEKPAGHRPDRGRKLRRTSP